MKSKPLSDRQVELVCRQIRPEIGYCDTCVLRDEEEPVWPTNNREFISIVQYALDECDIKRDPEQVLEIADQLEFQCPCGAPLDRGSEVSIDFTPPDEEFLEDAANYKSEEINALVMFADVSSYSDWVRRIRKYHSRVGTFLKYVYALFTDGTHFSRSPYTKMMGDGILMIWELGGEPGPLVNDVVGDAIAFHTRYAAIQSNIRFAMPQGIRFGFTVGPVIRLSKSRADGNEDFRDYVGYHVNLASRVQGAAPVKKTWIHGNVKSILGDRFTFKPVAKALNPDAIKKFNSKMRGVRSKDKEDLWEVELKPLDYSNLPY